MPTNQSSPWEGGDVRDGSTADSPTTKHPKATKVPLRPAFVEVPGGRSPARPLLCDSASPVPPSVPVSAPLPPPPPVSSIWSYNKTNSLALPAGVPHVSSNILHRLNGSRRLSQVLAAGAKQDKKATLNAAAAGSVQKQQSTADAQPTDRLKVSQLQEESIEPLDWRPFLSVSTIHCREKPSARQLGKVVVSSRRSLIVLLTDNS